MRSVQKVSNYVIWKIDTFIDEDTRNIVHRKMMPQSLSKWAPWDLTQFSQSPSAAPLYFPESHQWSEISSLSKVTLVSGKGRSHRAPNLGCSGAESPEWKLGMSCDAWAGMLSWWSCQSPVAHSGSLLNHLNSFHGGIFKLNSKFDAILALLGQSFWMWWPHSTNAHSRTSTTPTD